MKKIIFILLVLSAFQTTIFASEVSDLLDKAKSEYEKGNISEAINLVNSTRKILDKENLQSSSDKYIEITNWNIVTVKKTEYIGKKIKITSKFQWISSDGARINLSHVGSIAGNPYNASLTDKVLELQEYKDYTFYGTVKDEWNGPMLYIEAIE